jgi:1,4-dihydroxy-2-naphthoate octaprenyltransferase
MRHFAQLILGLAYITMIGYIVYHFTNPWWSLMLLFTPMLLRTLSDENDQNPDMM